MVNATPSTVANGNDIQRKKNGYFDMPILPANVWVGPCTVFRGGNGHHGVRGKMIGIPNGQLAIGLTYILPPQHKKFHTFRSEFRDKCRVSRGVKN